MRALVVYGTKRAGTFGIAEWIADTLTELQAAGVRLIDSVPRRGAHGWRVAFVHPESCHGVLTEFVEE